MQAKRKYDSMEGVDALHNHERFVIGIDWGTTYSGVAYFFARDHHDLDKIHIVKEWSGSDHMTSDKTPSRLKFVDADGSNTGTVRYGYEIKPLETGLNCLKLLLDPKQEFPAWATRSALEGHLKLAGKGIDEAVAAYLVRLLTDARKALELHYGATFVAQTQVEFVITVPALWTEAAKDLTLKCAQQALKSVGLRIAALKIVPEPEAAATYALLTLRGMEIDEGDVFITCDAGGGTVDLSTFQIVSATSQLTMKEFILSEGGLCGASFVNQAFERLLERRLNAQLMNLIRVVRPEILASMLTYFEVHVKNRFTGADDSGGGPGVAIPVPGVENNEKAGIKNGFMSMSLQDLRQLFEPVIEHTIKLIENQFTTAKKAGVAPKAVIMVGGFSSSPYLIDCVRKKFSDQMEVIKSTNSWSAVVRGAVIRGLPQYGESIVESRKARAHYGVTITTKRWVKGVHSDASRWYDDILGCDRAENVMLWLVRKGQTVSAGQRFEHVFHQNKWEVPRSTEETLFVCEDDAAPRELGPGVRPLCTVSFPSNPRSLPPRAWAFVNADRRPSGRPERYRQLDFKLSMAVEAASLDFSVIVRGAAPITAKAEFL